MRQEVRAPGLAVAPIFTPTSHHFTFLSFSSSSTQQERDYYEALVRLCYCISITIWRYTPTILIQPNMITWDLLKSNSQSSFKLERSPQATLIKSRTFRVQESFSQIMKNSFRPYQSEQHNKLLRANCAPKRSAWIISRQDPKSGSTTQ